MTIDRIIKTVKENNPKLNEKILREAYEFARLAHGDQKRKSGEPYIQHSLHTAFLLAQIKADIPTIIAGILHDVPEDTDRTVADIRAKFGKEVADLVNGITKLGKIKYRGIQRYRENLRKMFLAMASDIRVTFIKFCDRLHNLRTLESLPEEKRLRIAKETLEIYAPIAGLLGIWRLKWQMEDICFKYIYPEEFEKLEYKYEVEKKVERNQFIQKIRNQLAEKLETAGIEYSIEGRFKHLYSIWTKMQRKDRKFDEIYDVFALRIVVRHVDDCYKVLGIIHSLWRPKTSRFKDYIAVPKPNGYRSLHTTVFGPEGKLTEFQIRTDEMDEEATFGLAAHWFYKSKTGAIDTNLQPKWISEILTLQKEFKNTDDFIKKIKFNIFQHRIFVFSPKGDVFELPENSTTIDFAYTVHTEIGNKAVRAIINDKESKLEHVLKNGDLCEIIIDKSQKYPNRNWLKFVKTKKARDNIKQYSHRSTLSDFGLNDFRKYIPGIGSVTRRKKDKENIDNTEISEK